MEPRDIEAVLNDVTNEFKEEARKDIEEDDVWYPMVKAGLTYRF